VGEVICTIGNPAGELIPGTNVNAAIRTSVAQNALVLPKEVLRRDAAGTFVFVLRNGTVAARQSPPAPPASPASKSHRASPKATPPPFPPTRL